MGEWLAGMGAPPCDYGCPLVFTIGDEGRDEPPDKPAGEQVVPKDTNGVTRPVNRHEESKAHRARRWRER